MLHHVCLIIYVLSFQAAKYGDTELAQNISSFVINVIESAVKVWHDTGIVDARVNFLLDDQKTDTEKYAPVVNIEKVLCCFCLRMLRPPASHKLVQCIDNGQILRFMSSKDLVWFYISVCCFFLL